MTFSLLNSILKRRATIDKKIAIEMGGRPMASFGVHTKTLPSFRFVDLHRAIEESCAGQQSVRTIESEHIEDLNAILHGKPEDWMPRDIKRSNNSAWPAGPGEEIFLPVDCFWLCAVSERVPENPVVIRLRYNSQNEAAIVEVASEDTGIGEKLLRSLIDGSVERSIYRNRILELAYEAGTQDEYGDVEKTERLRVLFRADEPVDDDDVVIGENVRQMLWRNVVDLHQRRDILRAVQVPLRRGVLLYGPPGTGKTYACRYLCSKLPETTRIIVTGSTLQHVGPIFSLARMLQPSLLGRE